MTLDVEAKSFIQYVMFNWLKPIFFVCLLSLSLVPEVNAQDIVSEINESSTELLTTGPGDLITEKLLKVSPSRRIFVISNNNSALFKGDFFSILFDNKLTARALVAKVINDRIAIKIMKIYSIANWERIKLGMEMMILKGDDSFFRVKQEDSEEAQVIKEEEDLFNDTFLEEDASLDEKSNRIIKPDNIAAFQYGQLESIDNDGAAFRYEHFNGSWAYQLGDNVWGEFMYGQGNVQGFPAADLTTILTSYTFRLKYTIAGPWYSYIMPYGGYQSVTAESDAAGTDPNNSKSSSELQNELNLLDSASKSQVIFGVTILKRFVPGWFLRADLGSDIVNFGLALEF
jgi:hypothetical protein